MSDSLLTVAQARRMQLAAQGLLQRPKPRATRSALLDELKRMQLLQIDTISVVARSPYLVLFSRLGSYQQAWLDEALEQGQIFETWAHEACFAPIADWPWHRAHQLHRVNHWALKHAQRIHGKHAKEMAEMLAHIERVGPVRSADFVRPRQQKAGWWGWKDEKRWLEALFATGELMVARRDGFQRVYDLSSRVLQRYWPQWQELPLPELEQTRNWMIEAGVRALGVSRSSWIGDYFRLQGKVSEAELQPLLRSGKLIEVRVEGWPAPGYVHSEHADLLARARSGALRATHSAALSPFDPLVWDRQRASELFDFDYRLECYTPALKRQWGYYVLPLLHAGELIGRVDAKAHRREGVFELRNLYLQERAPRTDSAITAVAQALQSLADWHQTPTLSIGSIHQAHWARQLPAKLRRG